MSDCVRVTTVFARPLQHDEHIFQDKFLFYRFYDDEVAEGGVSTALAAVVVNKRHCWSD